MRTDIQNYKFNTECDKLQIVNSDDNSDNVYSLTYEEQNSKTLSINNNETSHHIFRVINQNTNICALMNLPSKERKKEGESLIKLISVDKIINEVKIEYEVIREVYRLNKSSKEFKKELQKFNFEK